jgi:hypothetical protein
MSRRVLIVAVVCAFALSACARSPKPDVARMQWSRRVSGWLSWEGGFVLFHSETSLASRDLNHCTSVGFPTALENVARDSDGRHVTLSGRMVIWTAGTDDRPTPDRDRPVRKVCDGPLIFLANAIRKGR